MSVRAAFGGSVLLCLEDPQGVLDAVVSGGVPIVARSIGIEQARGHSSVKAISVLPSIVMWLLS